MQIGIIADTHDCLPLLHRAVERFETENIDLVLHAGDFIAPFVIPALARLSCNLIGVFGNNDGDRALLQKKADEFDNLEIRGYFAEIAIEDRIFGLIHGSDTTLLHALIAGDRFDAIIHGHTHQAAISTHGNTLVINPGEACGYLTDSPTIGLLDTDTMEACIVPI